MDKDLVLLKAEMIKAYYKDRVELMTLKSIINNANSTIGRCEYCGTKIIGNHTHCISCGAQL